MEGPAKVALLSLVFIVIGVIQGNTGCDLVASSLEPRSHAHVNV